MNILFTGGGSLGPVTPLLEVARRVKELESTARLAWIGTTNGPEFDVVESEGIPFFSIQSGKFRRYFSVMHFIDPFKIIIGFFQALMLLHRLKPQVVVSAGGYVALPVIVAARVLRIAVHVHAQDILPGLTNKLSAPLATSFSIAYEKSSDDFPKSNPVWTGNPVRSSLFDGESNAAIQRFNLEKGVPTIVVLGGGQGAVGLNHLVVHGLATLTSSAQVIHVTGKGKGIELNNESPRYHQTEFIVEGMGDLYAIADVVVTRAGVGTLSELSALAKPTIIVPMSNSHQEKNAAYFLAHGAARVIDEREVEGEQFAEAVLGFLANEDECRSISQAIVRMTKKDAGKNVAEMVLRLSSQKNV